VAQVTTSETTITPLISLCPPGKTEVVVKRMVQDAMAVEGSRLCFIAHTQYLCKNARSIFVREACSDESSEPTFCKYGELLHSLERNFGTTGQGGRLVVDYSVFHGRMWPEIARNLKQQGLNLSSRPAGVRVSVRALPVLQASGSESYRMVRLKPARTCS